MSKVVVLKLVSGEEVLANLENEEENFIVVTKPMVVQIMPSKDGYGVGLVPYIHSKSYGEFLINKEMIVCNADPDSEVEKGYLSQTSGIQLA